MIKIAEILLCPSHIVSYRERKDISFQSICDSILKIKIIFLYYFFLLLLEVRGIRYFLYVY